MHVVASGQTDSLLLMRLLSALNRHANSLPLIPRCLELLAVMMHSTDPRAVKAVVTFDGVETLTLAARRLTGWADPHRTSKMDMQLSTADRTLLISEAMALLQRVADYDEDFRSRVMHGGGQVVVRDVLNWLENGLLGKKATGEAARALKEQCRLLSHSFTPEDAQAYMQGSTRDPTPLAVRALLGEVEAAQVSHEKQLPGYMRATETWQDKHRAAAPDEPSHEIGQYLHPNRGMIKPRPSVQQLEKPKRSNGLGNVSAHVHLILRKLLGFIKGKRHLFGIAVHDGGSIFAAMDTDGDGVISSKEFIVAMRRMDLGLTFPQVPALPRPALPHNAQRLAGATSICRHAYPPGFALRPGLP